MKIIVAGGTGLVGRHLVPALGLAGHSVIIIGRDKDKIKRLFPINVQANNWNELDALNPDEVDAVINLCGENIADHRWSQKVKNNLLSSRLDTTNQFILWCAQAKTKKPHVYNASAVGIYGLQKSLPPDNMGFTETDHLTHFKKECFSSQLVTQWEQAAMQGADRAIPITLMRFGVVLKRGEGMLKKLELPARYGLGAVIGTGEQPLSWIDCDDLINAIVFLINHPEITGPVNLTSPEFVSQKKLTNTLAKILKKRALLWLPAWFVTLLLGQMGEELLLSGQAVTPQRLLEHQFHFKYPSLWSSLTKEFIDIKGSVRRNKVT